MGSGSTEPHRSSPAAADPGVSDYFGDALRPILLIPTGGHAPGAAYLTWHHENIYQGDLAAS
ncbi:MAG: hypothetical protein IPG97_07275 [Microthrixaceae bacterium]|nr:hypothetical protein [Microthrixaceae bacterium]